MPPAKAVLESGLRFRAEGPDGKLIISDMPETMGKKGSAPSPGWLMQAALATCNATTIVSKAALEYQKAIQQQPDHMFAHLSLAVCYVRLNRKEDAQAEVAEVLRINPKFSVKRFAKNLRVKDQSAKQRHIDGMRKLGLPE